MKETLLCFVFLPLLVSNSNSTKAEVVVRNEVSGDNASVHTEITNIVNEKEVKVESDKPGEIKVEVKNGEVKVESSPEASPTVVISEESEEEEKEGVKNEVQERIAQVKQAQERFFTYLEDFFTRLRRAFFFWR